MNDRGPHPVREFPRAFEDEIPLGREASKSRVGRVPPPGNRHLYYSSGRLRAFRSTPAARFRETLKEVGVSSQENPQSQYWTYRMEVTPTGQPHAAPGSGNEAVQLLQVLVNLQSQVLETQRQILELQRQQLELTRETVQVARDQRARQLTELERWQSSHESVLDSCKDSVAKLEQVHSALMREMTDYVQDNHENLLDGDFALTDFVDRFGPRLAHLNTMLAVLRPLTAQLKKSDG